MSRAWALVLLVWLFLAQPPAPMFATGRRPAPVPCAVCWHPSRSTTWQWQLSGALDTKVPARIYDVDMFGTTAKQVATLHHSGRKAVCYIDAGSWESYRPDAARYPKSLLGKKLQGWPQERWLDIRRIARLAPLIRHRVLVCKRKGFDGVEFDNVDGYENNSGFHLTALDQLHFNIFLANLAHRNHLAVALKNDPDQVKTLEPYFDWSLDEQCFQYSECQSLLPFIHAGKPVVEVEYYLPRSRFCSKAAVYGFNAMRKHLNLGPWLRRCGIP